MNKKQWMLATSLSLVAWGAQALQITSFSPQGEVARVRQAVAKFDAAAVNFGDPKAPAPLSLSCSDASAAKGAGSSGASNAARGKVSNRRRSATPRAEILQDGADSGSCRNSARRPSRTARVPLT